MNKFTVYWSILQIYNEKLYDLLQDSKAKKALNIREDAVSGIYVEGLAEFVVNSSQDWYALMKRGERNRITKSTRANIQSSRSHWIFQLLVETDQVDKRGMLKRAKLNLWDLAGSEKIINKEENISKAHFLELKTINLSLTTLGKVIAALSKNISDKKASKMKSKEKLTLFQRKFGITYKTQSIPYRESKLTRLLQDSLGGNTRTWLIAAVAPTIDHSDETISTLKFADRAKQVMVKVKANELDANDNALVQKLHKEVQHLRQILNLRKKGKAEEIQRQLFQLQNENQKLRQLASNTEEVERLKLENKIMRLELQRLRYEDGSNGIPDNENQSYSGSISQLEQNNKYELNSMIRYGAQSEIEKPIDPDIPLKWPLWDSYPPWAHYTSDSGYNMTGSLKHSDSKTQRQNNTLFSKKRNNIPALARSRENMDEDNPYSIDEIVKPKKFDSIQNSSNPICM